MNTTSNTVGMLSGASAESDHDRGDGRDEHDHDHEPKRQRTDENWAVAMDTESQLPEGFALLQSENEEQRGDGQPADGGEPETMNAEQEVGVAADNRVEQQDLEQPSDMMSAEPQSVAEASVFQEEGQAEAGGEQQSALPQSQVAEDRQGDVHEEVQHDGHTEAEATKEAAGDVQMAAHENEENEEEEEEEEEGFGSQDEAIEAIVDAVQSLDDPFAIGSIRTVGQITIRFLGLDGEEKTLQLPQAPYVKQADGSLNLSPQFQDLLQIAVESPFGQGQVTKTDPNVRKARHVPPERILGIEGFNASMLLPTIQAQLFPQEMAPIEASLLKINIYREGDFFVAHRDTPMERSIGSLVVALPCAHFGGELLVGHRGDIRKFDFASDLGVKVVDQSTATWKTDVCCKSVESRAPYAAFYGDALHEIKVVKAGIRLSLSYQLLRPEGAPVVPVEVVEEPIPAGPVKGPVAAPAPSTVPAISPAMAGVPTPGSVVIPSAAVAAPAATAGTAPAAATVDPVAPPLAAQPSAALPIAAAAAPLAASALLPPQMPADGLERLTVVQLKQILRGRGMKVSGNKPELLARLRGVPYNKPLPKGQAPRVQPLPAPPKKGAQVYMGPRVAEMKSQEVVKVLHDALDCEEFFPDGGLLGFPCFHLYETDEDLPKEEDLKEDARAANIRLRGADALLAVAAARLGLRVHILRLMVCDNGGDGVVVTVPRLLTVQNAYKVAKPEIVEESYVMPGINLEDLDSSGPIGVEDVTWAIRIPHASLVDGVVDADVPQAPVLNPMMTETGSFGNEAGQGMVYSQCAIVIHIPPAGEEDRKRSLELSSKGLPPEAVDHTLKATLSSAHEEKVASHVYEEYARQHGIQMDIQDIRDLADGVGVPTSGSTVQLVRRIENALLADTGDFGSLF